mmetsp:Transcript_2592/g.3930  ORF Transcript_2592/g.3930 Transcript_2592/m.3930 type:complete len:160 (-) Transcript_2592:1781-2260(-)
MQTESKMNPRLKNESIFPLQDCFMRDGVVGPISVLTEQEAAKCLAKFEGWAEFFCDDKCRLNRDFRFKPHLYLGFVNQIIRHPKLIAAVSEVLKTDDIICWSSQFCIKGSNSDGIFCPHQGEDMRCNSFLFRISFDTFCQLSFFVKMQYILVWSQRINA